MTAICLLCSEEHIFQPPMLHRILERHHGAVTAAFVFPPLPGDGLMRGLFQAARLDGWRAVPRAAAHALEHARDRFLHSPPHYASVDALFRRFRIPVSRYRTPNDARCVAALRALHPEVILNTQPWRLKADVLGVPRLACLNQHTGDLTKYRGVEPVVRALLNREPRIQMTLHTMTPAYDAGRVLAKADLPVRESVFECYREAFTAVPELFDEALAALASGTGAPEIDPATAPYFGPLTSAEVRRFRQMGLRYL